MLIMKTIAQIGMLTTYTTDVIVGIWDNGSITFKSISVNVVVENSSDYKVNNQIPLVDWLRSMLHGKIIVPASVDIDFPEYLSILRVETVEIDYVLLTLLLILEKLNNDESITFKMMQYGTN